MSNVMGYVKAHPWTVGILVVVGGFVFIKLSGVFSGGGGGTVVAATDAGPSEAAQLQFASINAQASAANNATAAHVTETGIGADLQKYLGGLQLQLATHTSDNDTAVQLAGIQSNTQMFTVQNGTALDIAKLNTSAQTHVVDVSANVQNHTTDANTDTIKAIIGAFGPQPAAPAAPAPAAPNPVLSLDQKAQQYLDKNPDVATNTWLNSISSSVIGDLDHNGQSGDANDRAIYHYSNFGSGEGRAF